MKISNRSKKSTTIPIVRTVISTRLPALPFPPFQPILSGPFRAIGPVFVSTEKRIAISNSKRKKPIGKEKLGDNHEGRGLITSGTSFPRREWPLNRREESSVTDTRIVEIRGNVRCYWLDLYCSWGWVIFFFKENMILLSREISRWTVSSRWKIIVVCKAYAIERFWSFSFFNRENCYMILLFRYSKFYIYREI